MIPETEQQERRICRRSASSARAPRRAAVWMSVLPAACSVAAVEIMIASATRLENRHPDNGVDAACGRTAPGASAGSSVSGFFVGMVIELLDLLGALPEEKIGTDRRAEDRDDGRCGPRAKRSAWDADHAEPDRAPQSRWIMNTTAT